MAQKGFEKTSFYVREEGGGRNGGREGEGELIRQVLYFLCLFVGFSRRSLAALHFSTGLRIDSLVPYIVMLGSHGPFQ